MKLNLLENSMDSLSEAIDYYLSGKDHSDERCYKFCIIMLYHSAELLLKEILHNEHKTLILENVDDYGKSNPKTIGMRIALDRVRRICNVELDNYFNALVELADTRNIIQHYEIVEDAQVLIKIIISTFSAIEYLIINALGKNFNEFGDIITIDSIDELHSEIDARSKRKEDIQRDISNHDLKKVKFEYRHNSFINIPCPNCAEECIVYNNESIICHFCSNTFESLSDLYDMDRHCVIAQKMQRELGKRKHILAGLHECPFCNYNSLIYRESDNELICASCGAICESNILYAYYAERGREDYEADLDDMREDPHYSHLW